MPQQAPASDETAIVASERLCALANYSVTDTTPEAALDSLAQLAAQLCDAPTGLITLVDGRRQLFKARVGFDGPATAPLDVGFCPIVVEQGEPVVIPDTLADPAHAANAATREGNVRFYAGVPLLADERHVLGTLCVLDKVPRPGGLTQAQLNALQVLSSQVVSQFELRRSLAQRDALLAEQRVTMHEREALARVQAAIVAANGDLDTILAALVVNALAAVPTADGGVLELIDGDALEYRAVGGTLGSHKGLRVPLHGSLAGSCAAANAPALVDDARNDGRVVRDLVEPLGLRAAVLVPVARGSQVLGMLKLQSNRPGAFGPRDLQVAQLFAGAATAGLTEVRAAEAQRAVLAGVRRQRAIFDSAVDIAIIATGQDGRVTDWNTGAECLFGWTAGEMRGETLGRIFTPEDQVVDRIGTEMRLALEQGRASDERWHVRRDGSRFWASGEMVRLRDGQDTHAGFFKMLRDRTAEHRAGETLRETEAALQRAQEAGGVGLFSVDIQHNVLKGTPEFCRLYGVPIRDRLAPEEIEGLVPPEYAVLVSSATKRTAGDIAPDVEYRIRRADTGELRWIWRRAEIERDGAGQPVHFIGVVRDITEQRSALDALARSEARYRALFEAIDDGFCIIEFFDGPHGPLSDYVHIEANPGFERQTGIADIVGRTLRGVAPDEADGWAELYGGVLRTGQPIRFEREFAAVGRYVEVSAARVEPASRRQVSVLFRDVTARKQAEAALRDREARLRLATTSARLGTFDYRVQTNELIWDSRCRELFGLPTGVPVSYEASFLPGLHPEDRAQTVEAVERSMDPAGSGHFAAEYRTIGQQDSVERWVSANGETLFENGAPMRLIGTVLDITDRKRAEAALRASEAQVRENAQRVQLALEAGAIIGTWFWDMPTDRFTVDEAFARSFGLDPALGRVGLSLEQVVATVHPDDMPGLATAIDEAIARGGAYAHQYRVHRADGRYYWIEANGRVEHAPDGTPLSFPGVLIDLEERRAVEAERDRVTAELRALTETLEQRVEERTRELHDARDFTRLALTSIGGVGAWTYDVASDRFFCSPAIAELYGIDPVQGERGISRVAFLANVHPDDKIALATIMAGGLEKAGDLELEYRLAHPNGSIRWVLSRGYTYHEDGRPTRRLGIGVETTKQHQLQEQLRQSQKMEAVGQLTGGIAHDFNNLLTGISGSLELLGTRIGQGRLKDLDRYVSAAQGAAKRAASLTHRLLAFSRRQTLDPRPTDVNRLVAGMEDLIRRTVGPAVEIEVVGAAGLWSTLVDPPQLESALLNLCINARDAMAQPLPEAAEAQSGPVGEAAARPEGGRLTIETANRWLDQRAAQERDLKPGQYVSLCVSDTGTGMAPEVIARAFDPFFTTKPLGQGTGLGLSMIHGFVRQSGGQARIYSEPGQGTMVCLYLPRHLGDADAAEAAPDLTDAPRAEQGETVLVVDDEPVVRMLVTEVLEELGYAAIEAADGASGLRVLQSDARVDLLVTDVGLPGGMNGRQMADAARVGRPGLKVLFITGYAENAVVGNGHLDPGMHVMTKPFAMEALASRIRELIAGR